MTKILNKTTKNKITRWKEGCVCAVVSVARLEDNHTHVARFNPFQECGVLTRAAGLKGGAWDTKAAVQHRGRGGSARLTMRQTGRGLHRQLEGIRVSDRDLSDAAVAAPD